MAEQTKPDSPKLKTISILRCQLEFWASQMPQPSPQAGFTLARSTEQEPYPAGATPAKAN